MAKLEPVQLDIITKSDGKGLKDAEQGIAGFSKNTIEASKKFAVGVGVMGTALVGLGVKTVKAAGDQEQLAVAFTTMLGSADKAKTLMQEIAQFAASTPFELTEVQKGSRALLAFGIEAENIIPSMKNLGDIAAGVGINIDELAVIYGKARTAGTLYAEDINQLTERGVPIIAQLAKQFGVAESEIKKLVSQGTVGFSDLEEAFKSMSGEGGQFYNLMEAQSQTLLGKWSNLQDGLHQLSVAIGQQLLPAAALLVTAIVDFIPKIAEFTQWLSQNKEAILILAGAIAGGVTPALVGMGIAAVTAFGSMMIAIGPWMIAGAALVALAFLLYKAWNENMFGIQEKVQAFTDWFNAYVLPNLTSAFNWISTALTALWQIFNNVWTFLIKPMLSGFLAFFKNLFWTPLETVFNLMTSGLDALGVTWADVWNGIKALVFGVLGAIVSEVKRRINGVIDIFNALVNGANAVGDKVPGYTKINTIPNLFNGTDYFQGGMARVGEQGPENVYLPRGSRVEPYSPINGTSQDRPIEVTQIINSGADMDFAFRELAYILRTG